MNIEALLKEIDRFRDVIEEIYKRLLFIKNDKNPLFNNEMFKGDFLIVDERIVFFKREEYLIIIPCIYLGIRTNENRIYMDKEGNLFFKEEFIDSNRKKICKLSLLEISPFIYLYQSL